MRRATLSMVVLVTLSANSVLAQCADMMKWGIWEVRDNSSDSTVATSYINWLYHKQFSSEEEAHSATTSLSAGMEPIWLKLDQSRSDKSWKQFMDELQTYERRDFYSRALASSHITTASADLLRTVRECMNQHGVQAWIQSAKDPKVFWLRISFRPSGSQSAWVDDFSKSAGVECSPLLKKGSKIKPGVLNVMCTRKTLGSPAALNLNTDPSIVGEYDLSLPAVPPPCQGDECGPKKEIALTSHTKLYTTRRTETFGEVEVLGQKIRYSRGVCPASLITSQPSFSYNGATCDLQYIGDTVVEPQTVMIYTASVPVGSLTTNPNHNNAATTPSGYLLAAPRRAADVAVYSGTVAMCNGAMVGTSDSLMGCGTRLVGYVKSPD